MRRANFALVAFMATTLVSLYSFGISAGLWTGASFLFAYLIGKGVYGEDEE